MFESYYDSLVECTLMIGVNELSGLRSSIADNKTPNSQSIPTYQQQILAAISSTVAIFPFSKTNYKYPPEEFNQQEQSFKKADNKSRFKRQFSTEEFHIINELVSDYNKTDIGDKLRDKNFAMSINRRSSKYQSRRKSMKCVSLDNYKGFGSVSVETIKAFPGTYFNNNLKVSDHYIEPKIEILPMTDNLGNRSYAFRLEFHRHFSKVSPPTDVGENYREIKVEPIFETDLDVVDDIFFPCNIIFFSKYPYFNLFKDILSQLFLSIGHATTRTIDEELVEYSAILTRIPVMKSGSIQIDFSINQTIYSIKPNSLIFEQIIDWDMTLLFQILSLDDIVLIITAMFQDQKIAFFSKHHNITTIVCETLMVLFQPFSWKHFYLTVVPSHLYEFVDAIFPFLMGLPHSMKERVLKAYDDIFVVDLDEGSITKPKISEIAEVSNKLINQLKQGLCDRDWLTSRNRLSNISSNSLKDLKDIEYQNNKTFSEKIMLHFMMLMVDLFQEALSNITVEIKNNTLVANMDKFLANSYSENVEFFKSIYNSDNFNCFLDSKLLKMNSDSWVKICNNLYPDLLEHIRSQVLKVGKSKKNSIQFERDIITNLTDGKRLMVVNLSTSKNERKNYYQNTIDYLDKPDKTSEIYKLEIQIHLQSGNEIQALKSIEKLLLFDKDEIEISKNRKIVRGLERTMKKDVESAMLFKSLNSLLEIDVRLENLVEDAKHSVQQFNPPIVAIPKKDFIEICKNANITDFEDVVEDLFKCLTLNQKSTKKQAKLIPPELFQCFYSNWILCSSQFNANDINVHELLDEVLIMSSDPCVRVDDFGQGRILLTQMRLLFVPFGQTSIQVMVNFSDDIVKKIRNDRRIRGFGKLSEVIEIIKANQSKKIVMWLPQNIDVWYNLLCEVSAGNRLSNEEKDKIIQDKMTDHCLVYENFTSCARKNPYFKKYRDDISRIMLTLSISQSDAGKNGGMHSHRKYLIRKLMPCSKRSVTIDCAIAIYKPILQNSDLWCAVIYNESYFIKIFQIISDSLQILQSDELEFVSRIKIMIHLKGSTKIMVGCTNGSIFLIDSIDLTRQLVDINFNEGNYLTCAVCHQLSVSSQVIFAGVSNGEVLKFDQNFKQTQIISTVESGVIHFIEIYDDKTLVMASSHTIFITTTEGNILSVIEISNMKNIFNRISSLTVTNDFHNIAIGLSRLPVFIEYDISNKANPKCTTRKNLITNKDFSNKEFADMSESVSKFTGLSSILSIQNHENLWLIYKDGMVDIRDSTNLEKIDTFCAHHDNISKGIICEMKKEKIVVTVGKSDGKLILWNLKPL